MVSSLSDESHYLCQSDFELEEEDQEERDLGKNFWRKTELDCESCGDALLLQEEVILIQIVQAQNLLGRIECYPILGEEGDFEYEPLFLHFPCWEEICEERRKLLRDVPAFPRGATLTDILRCFLCGNGIATWEEFAHVGFGELTIAERLSATVFKEVADSTPESVCLHCMGVINEECTELWETYEEEDENE